jgi:hypothetical protein
VKLSQGPNPTPQVLSAIFSGVIARKWKRLKFQNRFIFWRMTFEVLNVTSNEFAMKDVKIETATKES